ncbi:MAG: HD domain-containing phosphohydrolase [Sphaerochaeta sp.]
MTRHIVTTDDDPAIRKILRIMLKKAGYEATTCENGEALLKVLSESTTQIDLILLDIKMPGLTGFELLQHITRKFPSIPVVMLTAFNDLDTGMKAIRLGAVDYLTKPIRQEELHACIQRVLEKADKQQRQKAINTENQEIRRKLETELRKTKYTLQHSTISMLEAFSETIEQKDPYTKGHCHRVRTLAVALGKALNLDETTLQIIEGGALLHDIGKISIPEEILNKNGSLTDEEYAIIKTHPEAGVRIITHIPAFEQYLPIVRSHHERIDGRGYPDRMEGNSISLDVKVVSLADAFDAMTSSRAYRSALPTELAVEELKLNAGTQFDVDLVDVFIEHELYLL